MSEQNKYQITLNYKRRETGEWEGWGESGWFVDTADNWQDAIHGWLSDVVWIDDECQVAAETPAEDGKSGIIEIQCDTPKHFWMEMKIKATLIDD